MRRTAFALLLAGLVSGQTRAATPDALYAAPARLVAVDGARRLNMVCLGHGKPVVMLEAGLGDNSLTWATVQKDIAATTEVCAYDRAGYGFSDPALRASNAANAADDLQRLVQAAGIATPFVLVAHSLGGLYATLFAALHRSEVAGMVLVDPSFAAQNRGIFLLSTPAQRAGNDARLRGIIARCTACLALARRGELSEATIRPPDCLPSLADPSLNVIARRQYRRAQTQDAQLSEILSISSFEDSKSSADSRAIDAAHPAFGAMKLIVLTRGDPTRPPAFLDTATQARLDAAWKAGHDRLAALSTNGQSRVVPHSGHYIQRDQPGAVLAAMTDVVTAVRAQGPR